jgi:1-acyl-sn-glycerol-3-phosphate acyltransferase
MEFTMPEWPRLLLYDFCRDFTLMTFLISHSLRFEGRHNVPPTGPALLVANHQSFFDPAAISASTMRRMHFLARKTLFNNPLFGWLIRNLLAVPVDQEGVAKDGMKAIIGLLHAGNAVLVFPEGSRSPDGRMQPLQPGVSLLIKRAPAPIIPIGIAGAFEAFPRGSLVPRLAPICLPAPRCALAVAIGKPFDPARYQDMSREQLLVDLWLQIQIMQRRAEQLRRKT